MYGFLHWRCSITESPMQLHYLQRNNPHKWPWKALHSFFFLHIFVMDLMFNKIERITAFQAQAICASAKPCRKSSELISVPYSTHSHQSWCSGSILFRIGWEGDLFSTWIPFPSSFHMTYVRQIPSRTDATFQFAILGWWWWVFSSVFFSFFLSLQKESLSWAKLDWYISGR